ncbi:MAG: biotin--protein ligase [Desulfonatronovibrionaceae bacterium]
MADKVFMLWDESHLWGLMLLRALRFWDFPLEVVSAGMVAAGLLQKNRPDILLVPGGWARLKSEALGEAGRFGIREYIQSGGVYMGFCGGAGLGLAPSGQDRFLSLSRCGRKPMHHRLPNFSGHIRCSLDMENGPEAAVLPVWWPSQFSLKEDPGVTVLSRYLEPAEDFWVSDLKSEDIPGDQIGKWEAAYGINLDPNRLRNEPCILQGNLGRGEFFLSYPHLESPEAEEANRVMLRLLQARGINASHPQTPVPAWDIFSTRPGWDCPALLRADRELSRIIQTGREHFLLTCRSPWLLGWRRGIPGSAINFLKAMLDRALSAAPGKQAREYWSKREEDFLCTWEKFAAGMQDYLLRERLVLAGGTSSPEASRDSRLQEEKTRLVGGFPGYGGLYGRLLAHLDGLLWTMAKNRDI